MLNMSLINMTNKTCKNEPWLNANGSSAYTRSSNELLSNSIYVNQIAGHSITIFNAINGYPNFLSAVCLP